MTTVPPLVVRPATRLDGDFDVEEIIARIPTHTTVKGAFISRLASAAAGDWPSLVTRLRSPPKLGRYLPFSDYPIVDYARLLFSSVHRLYPSVGTREGVRRFARDDFRTFTESVLGRVMMATVGDFGSAMRAVPLIFRSVVAGGPRVEVRSNGAQGHRVEFTDFQIPWEYAVGQLEGIVQHYEHQPTIVVASTDPAHFAIDVAADG